MTTSPPSGSICRVATLSCETDTFTVGGTFSSTTSTCVRFPLLTAFSTEASSTHSVSSDETSSGNTRLNVPDMPALIVTDSDELLKPVKLAVTVTG